MKSDIKNKAIKRLKIIEGQVRGLSQMIEQEKYCIDILHQIMALKAALSGVQDLILQNHLSTHVLEQIKSGNEQTAIKEMLDLYKKTK